MRSILAIAFNLFREVMRMRVLLIITAVVLLGLSVGVGLLVMSGSSWADEQAQTLLSYGLGGLWSYLALLTIFLGISTVTREIRRRHITMVATKPVSRGRFLLGKLLGVAMVNLLFLVIGSGLVYAMTHVIARTQPQSDVERRRVDDFVLSARRSFVAPTPDIRDELDSLVEDYVEQGVREGLARDAIQVDAMRRRTRETLRQRLLIGKRTVGPGEDLLFHFSGMPRTGGKRPYVYLRYKLVASRYPPSGELAAEWIAGSDDPRMEGGRGGVTFRTVKAPRTVDEIAIPAELISETGELYVLFRNPLVNSRQYPVSVVFQKQADAELLVYVAGFAENYVKAVGMIFLRLMLLAVMAVGFGACLSFPVAVLLTLVIFLFGLLNGFLTDAYTYQAAEWQATMGRIIQMIAFDYGAYDPVPLIEKGREVTWQSLSRASEVMGLLSRSEPIPERLVRSLVLWKDIVLTLILGGIGYVIFRMRELARVVV